MFLSSNDDHNQISELRLHRININDSVIEFINNNYKIRVPLKNILFINQQVYFKVKEINKLIDNYYKDKFISVLDKIRLYSKTNPFINENAYVILTSNMIKIKHKSHYYTTHNAILIAPSKIEITFNPEISVIPILEHISYKFSNLVNSPDHIIEQQNFDSSFKFKFIWKTEITDINNSKINKRQVFVSLNKEGVYISDGRVNII